MAKVKKEGMVLVRIITDRQPWFEGRPLHEGDIVEMSVEDARLFVEKRFAMEVDGD